MSSHLLRHLFMPAAASFALVACATQQPTPGARLTRDAAIRIAEDKALARNFDLAVYAAPKATFDRNGVWWVTFVPRDNAPGTEFSVRIDDRTSHATLLTDLQPTFRGVQY